MIVGNVINSNRQIENTGSVGGVEILYDNTNQRVKGWIRNTDLSTLVLRDEHDLRRLEEEVLDAMALCSSSNGTRVTLRVLAENPGLIQNTGLSIEGIVPLTSGRYQGISIVYLGWNDESRLSRQEYFAEQQTALNRVTSLERRNSLREVPAGYSIEELVSPTPQDVSQVIDLMHEAYSRDGRLLMWYTPTHKAVRKVLNDSVCYIAREYSGKIVSMTAAERAENVMIGGKNVAVYEASDGATLREHRGKGLLQSCLARLLCDPRIQKADSIYAEARIAHTPILRAMHNAGFQNYGVIRNHCLIGGDRDLLEDQDIETLVIFALPRYEKCS
ncbi:GNAT family N-acetyltransferase [Candidatus Woesearchaeota archaeon]|nr:GNAT family N-acetyltransferase [Candidatus Woesearchaeota archaeon]